MASQFSSVVGYQPIPSPSNADVVKVVQQAAHRCGEDLGDVLGMLGFVSTAPEDTTSGLYCRNGHAWSKNLTYDAEGSRRCRTCRTEQSARSYRAGKA